MQFVQRLVREIMCMSGSDEMQAFALASRAVDAPWVQRGVRAVVARFGLIENDRDQALPYAVGYEDGAKAALRLARAVLSDPIVRGHEELALDMIEQGFGHADVRARINSRRADAPDTVIVNLGDRRKGN